PYLRVKVMTENSHDWIQFVEMDSPAAVAGVDAGDQLLAIDGLRVKGDQLCDRLKDYQAGDVIELSVFHQDQLVTLPITLGKSQPSRYQVMPVKNPTNGQQQNFSGWLGASLAKMS
ncbi:PDZ domain-containing protein, partial [Moorena sp. SIO4G3]|uniref:PDZ domain-containing protein n=1 Tax=Moorena sp. SIO4G3 TaxID=2607821 RepID=UPI00142C2050